MVNLRNQLHELIKEKKVPTNYKGKLSDFIEIVVKMKKLYIAGISSAKVAPERQLTVIYEQLVIDVESETRKICRFLGIPWSEQMMYPSRINHLGEELMIRKGVHYTAKSFNRDPETHSINKWENQLT